MKHAPRQRSRWEGEQQYTSRNLDDFVNEQTQSLIGALSSIIDILVDTLEHQAIQLISALNSIYRDHGVNGHQRVVDIGRPCQLVDQGSDDATPLIRGTIVIVASHAG